MMRWTTRLVLVGVALFVFFASVDEAIKLGQVAFDWVCVK